MNEISKKLAKKEYDKSYRQKNLEKIKSRNKKYYEYNKMKISKKTKVYYEKNKERIIERQKKYGKEQRQKINSKERLTREKAFETIAKFHNHPVECHSCHESRIWLLTIGHLEENGGKKDRDIYGSHTKLCRLIAKGNIIPDKVEIECWNCNMSLEKNGRYPDEMTLETWRKGKPRNIKKKTEENHHGPK